VSILNRLTIWWCETVAETLCLVLFLTARFWRGTDIGSLVTVVGLSSIGTFAFMVGSGYLLTTCFFGVVWRSSIPWVYPAIAATLFVVHVQVHVTAWEPLLKLTVQFAGACIVMACTLLGNYVLPRWT